MAVNVSEVRSETQIPATLISDTDVQYAIGRVGENGLYAVCAYVCQMMLRKYRGRNKVRIGNVWEEIDLSEMRRLITEFNSKAGYVPTDTIENPDAYFTRDGI